MIVLVYLAIAALVSIVAHWLLGADHHDALLAGVAWPLAGMLVTVLGLCAVAASPVLLGLWIINRRRINRRA